jgi:hypothetical protein
MEAVKRLIVRKILSFLTKKYSQDKGLLFKNFLLEMEAVKRLLVRKILSFIAWKIVQYSLRLPFIEHC